MSGEHEGCRDDRTNFAGWHAHCWADDRGVWHARVTFPPGAEQPGPGASAAKVRAFARKAIREAITARGTVGDGWRCRVEVVEHTTDTATQRLTQIEYQETVTE